MAVIQTLSPHLADLIAAGEVVERPASVVKELLENSIDAGATAITVEIEGGGMGSIRISDNGCGIAREDLPTAFLRHATSKLRSEEELSDIGTLGFRGEALAAIASVSKIAIFSHLRGAPDGASLYMEGGIAAAAESAPCPEGTTITVSNLFYNTPARMKFMKKDSSEASAVAAAVQHLAVSHPNISIKFIKDRQEQFFTDGNGELLSAVYSAMGRDFALSLAPVQGCGGDILVDGLATRPLCGRGTRAMQHFFVNGRYVKSPMLASALEEAYRNQQMKGKFPGCVLHISLPLNAVDVNVHPAKTVVKFVRDRDVFEAVYHSVKRALEVGHEAPEFHADGAEKTTAQPAPMQAVPTQAAPTPAPIAPPIIRESATQHSPTVSQPITISARTQPVAKPTYTYKVDSPTFQTSIPPANSEMGCTTKIEDSFPLKTNSDFDKITPPTPISANFVQDTFLEEIKQETVTPEKPAPWRIAGEVLHTYIIAEEGETVWLIDKHAAHERINFDRLKANTEPIMGQQLLVPAAITLATDEYAALLDSLPLLDEFGFEAEDFGSGTLLVRTAPADIDASDIGSALEELAEKIVKCGSADAAAARDAMLHTMACKSAIKAGMHSDERELRVLVDKVQSGEIKFCPHGRPVAVRMTKNEIEKMFKRIV